MIDLSHIASQYGNADVQFFLGDATAAVGAWKCWQKPRGKTMAHILLVGNGGNGGAGVIGAAATAGGGGAGGSGAQTSLTIPLTILPDRLYLSLIGSGSALASYIAINPDTAATSANVLAIAGGGSVGGNGSGATNGTAGNGGAVATAATMPLGWMWADQVLAGQGGSLPGVAQSLPSTGLLVTSGTAGAALPAAGAASVSAPSITGSGIFPSLSGGAGDVSATVPGTDGQNGFQPVQGLLRFYGGTGGASTHGTATGAGLVQSRGGDGMPGCGGGGNGGALTGSTVAPTTGRGGPAFCIITCW